VVRGTKERIGDITKDLAKKLNRVLNEDDLEIIEYFLNGLEME